jgi:hypothetical protein
MSWSNGSQPGSTCVVGIVTSRPGGVASEGGAGSQQWRAVVEKRAAVYWVIVGGRFCCKTRGEIAVKIESRRRVRSQAISLGLSPGLSLTLTLRRAGSSNRTNETRIIFGKIDGRSCARRLDDCTRNRSDNGLVEVTVGHWMRESCEARFVVVISPHGTVLRFGC